MATPTTLPASFTTGQVLTAAQMNNLRGAFRILQVASTAKTDVFTTTSATFTDITGLTVTITPRETASRILIIATVAYSPSGVGGDSVHFRINGGNSSTYVGDAAGNRIRGLGFAVAQANMAQNQSMFVAPMVYLDSPNTTSATTYAVQTRRGSAGTAIINRSNTDTDSAEYGRAASSITVLEVSS